MSKADEFKGHGFAVLEPGSEGYERSVATSNLLYRYSRPAFVLQPKKHSEVQTIVRLAQEQEIKLVIKCSGHSYAGHSTARDKTDVLLDLREMRKVHLDMNAKTVTFGAGCQWGNIYKELVNGHHDGFVVNGGRCPFVGVSGYLLGAGLGPFSRSVGMGSDNVKEIKIVTADSRLVTVRPDRPGDPRTVKGSLFWALCGAGGGNFGVVVEIKMEVKGLRDPDVVAGRYQWFAKKGDAVGLFEQEGFLPTMNKFYTTDWPNYMTIDSTWICDLRQSTGNGVRFLTYFDGPKTEFDLIIDKLVTDPPLSTTEDEDTKLSELVGHLKKRSMPEQSTRFLHETLVAQWSEETVKAFPTNKSYSIYSSFAFGNDADTIEDVTWTIRYLAGDFRDDYAGERVGFLATFIHSGGRTKTPEPPVESAFFWRDAAYHMYLTVEWEDKWMEEEMREFLEFAKILLRPLSLEGRAAYVNFPDGALPPNEHGPAYWGDNWDRLQLVKGMWDEEDFFKSEQGIPLPAPPADAPAPPADAPAPPADAPAPPADAPAPPADAPAPPADAPAPPADAPAHPAVPAPPFISRSAKQHSLLSAFTASFTSAKPVLDTRQGPDERSSVRESVPEKAAKVAKAGKGGKGKALTDTRAREQWDSFEVKYEFGGF